MVITLFIIITIGFMVIRLMPGSMYADDADMTAAQMEILRAKYHLDKPIPVQYGIFLRDLVLKGDWGTSIKMYIGVPVFDVLKMKIPVSMYNNLFSLLISLPIGVLLGIIAAVRKNSIVDYTTSFMVVIFISVPSFIFATLLQYYAAFRSGWFHYLRSLGDRLWLHSLTLPIIAYPRPHVHGLPVS